MRELVKRVGGVAAAARAAECSEGVIRKWMRGESEPTRTPLALLARAGNVSLDWLAGDAPLEAAQERAPYRAPDAELLEYVIEGVETELAQRGLRVSPKQKARVVLLLMEYLSDRERDHAAFDRFLELLQP